MAKPKMPKIPKIKTVKTPKIPGMKKPKIGVGKVKTGGTGKASFPSSPGTTLTRKVDILKDAMKRFKF